MLFWGSPTDLLALIALLLSLLRQRKEERSGNDGRWRPALLSYCAEIRKGNKPKILRTNRISFPFWNGESRIRTLYPICIWVFLFVPANLEFYLFHLSSLIVFFISALIPNKSLAQLMIKSIILSWRLHLDYFALISYLPLWKTNNNLPSSHPLTLACLLYLPPPFFPSQRTHVGIFTPGIFYTLMYPEKWWSNPPLFFLSQSEDMWRLFNYSFFVLSLSLSRPLLLSRCSVINYFSIFYSFPSGSASFLVFYFLSFIFDWIRALHIFNTTPVSHLHQAWCAVFTLLLKDSSSKLIEQLRV